MITSFNGQAVTDFNSLRNRDEFESFRQKADQMQADAQALNHSTQAREVFIATAQLMAQIQQVRAADETALRDHIAKVREAADSVRADRRLLEQTTQVERFFQVAADAVSMLNRELGEQAQD